MVLLFPMIPLYAGGRAVFFYFLCILYLSPRDVLFHRLQIGAYLI
jgi:hypothetical protein